MSYVNLREPYCKVHFDNRFNEIISIEYYYLTYLIFVS